jgi:hypothetical protein
VAVSEKKKPICPFCDRLVVYGTKYVKCSNPHCKFSHGGCGRKAFDDGVVQMFVEFYSIYPNKKNPKNSLVAWLKLSPDKVLYKKIMKHVIESKEHSKSWKEGYIPMPTTYINGFRWEDSIERQKDLSFNQPSQAVVKKSVPVTSISPESAEIRKKMMALGRVFASGTKSEREQAKKELEKLKEEGGTNGAK